MCFELFFFTVECLNLLIGSFLYDKREISLSSILKSVRIRGTRHATREETHGSVAAV